MKHCSFCNGVLIKRIWKSGQIEPDNLFQERLFCSRSCVSKYTLAKKYGNPKNRLEKWCPTCKKFLKINCFYVNKSKIDGLNSECIKCKNGKDRKSKTGWTVERYELFFKKQKGKCEICNNILLPNHGTQSDHNHITNKPRGLLCNKCNFLLGHAKDNIDILKKAIKYLKYYEKTVGETGK